MARDVADNVSVAPDQPAKGSTPLIAPATLPKQTFLNRLSTGTGAFDVLGPRRIYYWVGIVLVVASILLIVFKGFHLGIDFAGGTKLSFMPPEGSDISTQQVADVFQSATGVAPDTVQTVGGGQAASVEIASSTLDPIQIRSAREALTTAFGLTSGVSDSAVSETWGQEVSRQALISVVVFLVAVALFIWARYDRRAAVAAVTSTIQVLIITAGIYALIGFEVSPATVIGLLTILGFSLYDTVVVFDKVQENTKGLTSLTRRTYLEAANLAVNQTLMRSINTSLIALLPVAGLLFAGIAILGSGTLKDLALVQLVGMLVGAYSSLFVAVPLAVDLRLRQANIKQHTARVEAKRKAEGLIVDSVGDPIGRVPGIAPKVTRKAAAPVVAGMRPGAAPKVGVRPVRPSSKKGKATTVAGQAAGPSLAKAATREPAPADTEKIETVATAEAAASSAPAETVEAVADTSVAEPAATAAPVPTGKADRPTGKAQRPTGKRNR